MKYLRTKQATDWPDERSARKGVAKFLSKLVPEANPDYQFHLVQEWLVEFDDEGQPGREIGLGANEAPVLAGPNERNYGFWLDTNMLYGDFEGADIDQETFEQAWGAWHERERSPST